MTEHSFIIATDFGDVDRHTAFNVLYRVLSSGAMNSDMEFLKKNFPSMTQLNVCFDPCVPEELAALTPEQLLTHESSLIRFIASQAVKEKK